MACKYVKSAEGGSLVGLGNTTEPSVVGTRETRRMVVYDEVGRGQIIPCTQLRAENQARC